MPLTRRSLLVNGGLLAGAAATSASAAAIAQQATVSSAPAHRKLKIVVTGGHPGDPEYACGGSIARLTQQGHDVVLLYLNDGAWPPTSAETRIAEARRACEILKARPAYAGQTNGNAVVDKAHYERFAAILNAESPDAVFTHWMIDNHRDHRATAMLCYDAWRSAKKKFALYYFEVSDGEDTLQFSPNRSSDISQFEATKKAACYAHASQTPDRYYALQDRVALFRGAESGVERAEAFLLQQQSPFDIFALTPTLALNSSPPSDRPTERRPAPPSHSAPR
jgi:N-acetylglucosamine malate deacetylase 1